MALLYGANDGQINEPLLRSAAVPSARSPGLFSHAIISFLAPSCSLSMDPVTAFGLAAGALQFLQCAFDLTKDTYLAAKDAKRDVLRLMAATDALSAVFATLGHKDSSTGVWQIAVPSLKTVEMATLFTAMEKELNALGTQLSGLEPLRDEHQLRYKLRSILPRLKWALRAEEVKSILSQIRTYEEVLVFATTAETLYVIHSCIGFYLTFCGVFSQVKLLYFLNVFSNNTIGSSTAWVISRETKYISSQLVAKKFGLKFERSFHVRSKLCKVRA
jgi:hypothetical protein